MYESDYKHVNINTSVGSQEVGFGEICDGVIFGDLHIPDKPSNNDLLNNGLTLLNAIRDKDNIEDGPIDYLVNGCKVEKYGHGVDNNG